MTSGFVDFSTSFYKGKKYAKDICTAETSIKSVLNADTLLDLMTTGKQVLRRIKILFWDSQMHLFLSFFTQPIKNRLLSSAPFRQ